MPDSGNPNETAKRRVVTLGLPSAASATESALQPGMTLGRRYQIVRRLGAGGVGEVYEARDISLDDAVALKILHPKFAAHPQSVDSLRREIRATRRLRHPAIARTYDWGASDGRTFLVMEYIAGEDLETRLKKGPMEYVPALRIFAQLLEALIEAHGAGVIHCDLKTANILITPDHQPRVMDFGLAAMHGLDARRGWGTPSFASPEQGSGGVVDARSDLYSLGVVFHHTLTGELPYRGANTEQLLEQHRSAPLPDVSALRPEIPHGMSDLVAALMAKQPEARPQRALDALVRLRSLA